MLNDIETAPSAKICQDVISLKRGSLKFQWSHTLTHTHTQRPLVKHWIARRKWLFGNLEAPPMAHRAFSLSSRLQSVSFLSFSLLLLPSPYFSLQFSSLSLVHGCGCLPTLSSWTCTPSLLSQCMSASCIEVVTAAREMQDSKRCVLALCGLPRLRFLVQRETWKSPCLRIQMKCSKNWAKAPLWNGDALQGSVLSKNDCN